jgi:hypothetical protein
MSRPIPCECGFWDRDRPHSRLGGGVCKYAFERKYGRIYNKRSDEIDRLRAQVEALKADAERYRWLRKGLRLEYLADQIKDGEIEDADPLDKAIDALRGKGE